MNTPLRSAYQTAAIRFFIGLVQGGALWFLHHAHHQALWPATHDALFTPLLAIALFVPAIVLAGIGNLRPRVLAVWTVIVCILCAGLGYYSGFREAPLQSGRFYDAVWPTFYLPLMGLLFVGHALVAAADADRKWIANFSTYFDVSWKQITQLALASIFVGLFWGVLAMGAALFDLIKIDLFATIIEKSWFWIPATTLATSAALHLTDSRATMVRGARALLLSLLSWLMPLMVLIGVAFLAALLFTGLEPLWNTRHATSSLLAAAIILILLINSHFQDGGQESNRVRALIYARLVAALMLVPLVVLATIGLTLRVEQHGWTPPRIVALVCLIAVGCHAFGYVAAALQSGTALRGLPVTNVSSAFVTIALTVALLTPVADPARLSVANQLSRLESGRITPDEFDYGLLERHTSGYGRAALQRLASQREGPNAAQIASKAADALNPARPVTNPPTMATRATNITVIHPIGQKLPESFIQQAGKIGGWPEIAPDCLMSLSATCEAILLDMEGDGTPEIILIAKKYARRSAFLLSEGADGRWAYTGLIENVGCSDALDALRNGKFELVPAREKDILADGQRLRFVPRCVGRSGMTPGSWWSRGG